jgi:hypothetical protein
MRTDRPFFICNITAKGRESTPPGLLTARKNKGIPQMSEKIKVTIEGKEHEVELPEGYISESDLSDKYVKKEFFENEIQRRVKTAKQKSREELQSDGEFFISLAKERGVPLTEDGTYKPPKDNDIDINKIKSEVEQALREREIAPRDEKINRFLRRSLTTDIVQAAAAAGIRKNMIEPLQEGAEPPIVNMLKDYFSYDEKNDYWAVRNGEGFAYSSNPTDSRPYQGAREFIESLKKNQTWADFFEDNRQRGASYSGKQQAGVGAVKSLKDFKGPGDKAAFIREHGLDKFKALPKE